MTQATGTTTSVTQQDTSSGGTVTVVHRLLRLARRILALQVFDAAELHERLPSAYNSLPTKLKQPGVLTFWFDQASDLHADDEDANSYNYDDLSGRWHFIEDVTQDARRERPELPMPKAARCSLSVEQVAGKLAQAARLALKLNITNPHMEPSRRDQVGRAAYDFAQDHIGEKDPKKLFRDFATFMSTSTYRHETADDFRAQVALRLKEKYKMPMQTSWTP